MADLAARSEVNVERTGADLGNLAAGLGEYLADKGLDDAYDLTLRKAPSYDWVRDEVARGRPAVLLLGFWELQPGGWRRLGGHYVSVAGVGCELDDEWLAISDPARDAAERGWAGRAMPATAHGHGPKPPYRQHNDAAHVSHDVYGITRSQMGWGLMGYARRYLDVANFAQANSAAALEGVQASAYNHGEILALVDYALIMAPRPERVTLRLAPAVSRVRAGQVFAVELEVSAGDVPVDGVQALLVFDPGVLSVVDEAGQPATEVSIDGPLRQVLLNQVDNAGGEIALAAGHLGAGSGLPRGRFRVATIRFKARAAAQASRVGFGPASSLATKVTSGGADLETDMRGGLVVSLPASLVAGQAVMQRPVPAPDPTWQTPMLLTLSRPGEPGLAYAYGVSSTQGGAFVAPGGVEPGGYHVRLKGLHTLRNLLPGAQVGPGANQVQMEVLLEGDANNDNRVDLRDVSMLARAYGKSRGETGYDARADLDQNGTVGAGDVELLRANLRRRGDLLVGVDVTATAARLADAMATALVSPDSAPVKPSSAGSVSLALTPASAQAGVGEVVTLDVTAAAGAQAVDVAALYLNFDPALLQLVDAAGQPAGQIEPGASLPLVLVNQVDAARGWINLVSTSLGGAAPAGDLMLARLRFRVLTSGRAGVRFAFASWRTTDVAYQAESVLGQVNGAHITVPAAKELYLPLVLKR